MKILNCITDEKFIDKLIEDCEQTKGEHIHDYVIFTEVQELKYIKNKQFIKFVAPCNFINYIIKHNYNALVIHSLRSIPFFLLRKIPNNIKVAWKAWGYDIYSFPHPSIPFVKIKGMYHQGTKKAIRLNLKNSLQYKHAYLYTLFNYPKIKQCIRRIDFFSGVLPEEFDFMKKHTYFHATRFNLNYATFDNLISIENLDSPITNQNNILIGNSGDPTNNHLDIFQILYKRNIKDIPIYAPLSYGGSKKYIEKVVQLGYKLFGKQFHPIIDFLPIKEYFKIIKSCSNVIMGHERQQAMGNINYALWQGCKVFLFDSSITYKHLQSHNFKIFSIQQNLESIQLTSYLNKEDVINNRKKLIDRYSTRANRQCLYEFYDLIAKQTLY